MPLFEDFVLPPEKGLELLRPEGELKKQSGTRRKRGENKGEN